MPTRFVRYWLKTPQGSGSASPLCCVQPPLIPPLGHLHAHQRAPQLPSPACAPAKAPCSAYAHPPTHSVQPAKFISMAAFLPAVAYLLSEPPLLLPCCAAARSCCPAALHCRLAQQFALSSEPAAAPYPLLPLLPAHCPLRLLAMTCLSVCLPACTSIAVINHVRFAVPYG